MIGNAPHGADRLIIFTRYPEPGRTKTRLIPALGPDGAASLHRRMTARVLGAARRLAQRQPLHIEVRFEGGGTDSMRRWLGPAYPCRPQGAGDLGERMRKALAEAFSAGAARAVLIGSDCPGASADHLRRAFAELRDRDLVLGPAQDGGYYLIGSRARAPDVFAGVAWGTGDVLAQTLAAAERAGLLVAFIEKLRDVDRPEDLVATRLAAGLPGADEPAPRISVIIPVLNEAQSIQATLASAQRGRNVEVIVVDGGSRDATVALARDAGGCVICGPACRAAQMNLGAAAAGGEVFLFLHGDTELPDGFDDRVRGGLAEPGMALGAFELGIDGRGAGLRLVEAGVNARSRRRGLPYGDQALFMRADVFRRVGGFREIAIMEDYALARELGEEGGVFIVPAPVRTSARRWHRHGIVGTAWRNALMVAGYRLGVSPDRLARWYRGPAGA